MFTPPRCPNPSCERHEDPGDSDFCILRGFYTRKVHPRRVQRFRCKTCRRSFSRQTFRMDYRDQRPDWNIGLVKLLTSGIGFRQTARVMGMHRTTVVRKFWKIARHLTDLNRNLRKPLDANEVELQLDELESYEERRNTRPLSLPTLIVTPSRFLVEAISAPIRPRGKMSAARRRAIKEDEERFGPREDKSREALEKVLAAGAKLVAKAECVVLQTDEKSTYPKLAAAAFGAERLVHETTNSKLARGTFNPLFPINHTEAVSRDMIGRLRRESWLVSKRGCYLDLHVQVYIAYRNWVRPRFNQDKETPAQILGLAKRPMTEAELLSWRQDWGERSIHPMAA